MVSKLNKLMAGFFEKRQLTYKMKIELLLWVLDRGTLCLMFLSALLYFITKVDIYWRLLAWYLIFTGFLDAYKYHVGARKIRAVRTARGHSRNFLNWAIRNDIVRIIYLLIHFDLYLLISSVLALLFMCEMWYEIYLHYSYKTRGLPNFKRPNICLYLLNSTLPNSVRKRL